MKICFLSQEYPPETSAGGIGTYTHNMATALARLGHDVRVLTSTRLLEKSDLENGVWVRRIRRRGLRPRELERICYSRALAKELNGDKSRPDIVQSSEFGGEACWISHSRDFPLVTRLATPLFIIDRLNGRASTRPILNWIERKPTLRSAGVFTSTRALADTVAAGWGIAPDRIEVIPNSVDVPRIIRLAHSRPAPESLQNKDFLLYFGRLEARKGVHVLARALPSVLDRYPGLSAVFVGSDLGRLGGASRDDLLREVGEYRTRIVFLDHLPQEELFPIVALAKIVVLPSLWEAFGFVSVEAMALGRTVVATSGSGFSEIIEDGVSGHLVAPGDSPALAGRIIEVLGDEASLRRVSERAGERARDFEVSAVALRLLDYYRRVRAEWLGKQAGGEPAGKTGEAG